MKIGIISDSHDNLTAIARAVEAFNKAKVGLTIHAGDLVAPFVSRPLKALESDFVAVFGNNDGERVGLSNVFNGRIFRPPHRIDAAGQRILILHEPDSLDELASCGSYDAVIYGHTHKVHVEKKGALVINPGECGGWLSGVSTAAVWDTETGDVEILTL
jgi:putative phosphoesterase